jgi:hypothetical protein
MLKTGRLLILIIATIFFCSAALNKKESILKYYGSATDKLSDKFYYTEEHEEIKIDDVHSFTKIVYKDQKGNIIAHKTIDYTKGLTNPSFLQEDLRDGYTEGAEVNGNQVKIIFRKNKNEPVKTKTITVPGKVVVDGGFNYFVKQNWTTIQSGNTVKFNFVAASQLNYFTFRVHKDSDGIYNGKKVSVYKMEADNFIIRSLLEPIILTYDAQNMRLMKYEGISNINDTNGKSYIVKITYPTVGP